MTTYGAGRSWSAGWRVKHRMSPAICRQRSDRTHPREIQGHLDHEMRGKYNHEVARRILGNGSENCRNLETMGPRPCRHEDGKRKCKEVCIGISFASAPDGLYPSQPTKKNGSASMRNLQGSALDKYAQVVRVEGYRWELLGYVGRSRVNRHSELS